MTALKLANRAVPIDSMEIFRPVKEAANAAKVIIHGVKSLAALKEKAGGAGLWWPPKTLAGSVSKRF